MVQSKKQTFRKTNGRKNRSMRKMKGGSLFNISKSVPRQKRDDAVDKLEVAGMFYEAEKRDFLAYLPEKDRLGMNSVNGKKRCSENHGATTDADIAECHRDKAIQYIGLGYPVDAKTHYEKFQKLYGQLSEDKKKDMCKINYFIGYFSELKNAKLVVADGKTMRPSLPSPEIDLKSYIDKIFTNESTKNLYEEFIEKKKNGNLPKKLKGEFESATLSMDDKAGGGKKKQKPRMKGGRGGTPCTNFLSNENGVERYTTCEYLKELKGRSGHNEEDVKRKLNALGESAKANEYYIKLKQNNATNFIADKNKKSYNDENFITSGDEMEKLINNIQNGMPNTDASTYKSPMFSSPMQPKKTTSTPTKTKRQLILNLIEKYSLYYKNQNNRFDRSAPNTTIFRNKMLILFPGINSNNNLEKFIEGKATGNTGGFKFDTKYNRIAYILNKIIDANNMGVETLGTLDVIDTNIQVPSVAFEEMYPGFKFVISDLDSDDPSLDIEFRGGRKTKARRKHRRKTKNVKK